MHIIFIFSVYCFGLKEDKVIFGCIGPTDTVVCSNLSYSLFSVLSVYLFDDALCYSLEKRRIVVLFMVQLSRT